MFEAAENDQEKKWLERIYLLLGQADGFPEPYLTPHFQRVMLDVIGQAVAEERDRLAGLLIEVAGCGKELAEKICQIGTRPNTAQKVLDELGHAVFACAVQKAVAREREACAKLAESEPKVWDSYAPSPQRRIAAKIRERSNDAERISREIL